LAALAKRNAGPEKKASYADPIARPQSIGVGDENREFIESGRNRAVKAKIITDALQAIGECGPRNQALNGPDSDLRGYPMGLRVILWAP